MRSRGETATFGLLAVTAVLMSVALWLSFLYAPDERVMGAPYRILYFHVPAAFVAFLSTFVMLAGSIGYLWTGQRVWNRVGRAATELAFLFCTVVLVTGPIWARPAWGVWWTWEAKLTTTLILWLLLAGCLLVRRQADDRERAARFASVLGIVAALDVPVIYNAVHWWRGNHPQVFDRGGKGGMDPRMMTTLCVCMLVFFLLYALLLVLRVRVASLEDRVDDLAEGWAGTAA